MINVTLTCSHIATYDLESHSSILVCKIGPKVIFKLGMKFCMLLYDKYATQGFVIYLNTLYATYSLKEHKIVKKM